MNSSLLAKGAHNAIKVCLGVSAKDRVVIVGDSETQDIDEALFVEAKKYTEDVLLLKIEDYGSRPLLTFPEMLKKDIADFHPTVSLYAAAGKAGELPPFRSKLMNYLLYTLKCRHGHMINITKQIMEDGMVTDYTKVYDVTMRLNDLLQGVKEIHVTSPNGTDLVGTFRNDWQWVPCHGRYHEAGLWGNLPEGEIFTTPVTVDGVIVCNVLGDYFSEKYGVLKDPVTIHMKNGYAWDVVCSDKVLEQEIKEYIFTMPLCNRVGEFSIGTNIGLTHFIGNLLQDEKYPGLHIAFGHSYPQQTGADWDAERHLDVIPEKASMWVDKRQIMKDGKFLQDITAY